jgi:hypothetical protein
MLLFADKKRGLFEMSYTQVSKKLSIIVLTAKNALYKMCIALE